ncbi:MAG: chromosome segregation protein [Methanolobus sp.]|uniref:chromosome segregation protein SMC n=1 Tax=Methanolobus sp. TaxID=1874737 RepID=UPI002583F2D2|nr:chromosome segregation protein SMC [Methanolobus sp.]MDK2832833.1 chromosome segregation protein [Methanolobus sp.]MDK2938256.1 chromosome segregation protein [Methanolobus sp.]
MHIKELEFINFKSFGKKVKIPFFDGFTTISGPNGSGKSNIIDGILFVLGLSSSRTLRAEKLTDLIYNGEGSKKPDFAQVTIRFDNTDREMPFDADEISITRKIRETDSGYYSYFYFNGKAVSLGDVHNYLAKARVTPEGYNVVMQGDVTRIINMTPGERRKIIDEIAGVAEFDSKRDRALSELEIVRERVERVDIIIEEVGQQLEKLKTERDQALKYQSLKEEKMKFEGFVLLAKLKDAKVELTSVADDILAKEEVLAKLEVDLEAKRVAVDKLEQELEEMTLNIQRMGEDEQIQIKKDIEGIRGEVSRCMDTIEISEKEMEDVESRRRKAFVDIDDIKGKLEELDSKISEETMRKESILAEMSERKTERMLLQSKIADVDAKFAQTRDELSKLKSRLEEVKNEKNELMRQEDRLLDSQRRKSVEARDIESEIADAKSKAESSGSDTKSVEYDIDKLNEKIDALTKDMDDLEFTRSQLKVIVKEFEDELRKHENDYARIEVRVRAAEDHSRYSKAVDMVMNEKKHHGLPGIYGTIAELGSVDQKYSNALGIAAGGRMQAVVVENDEDASRAISFLKQRRGGRATFLPLNKMEGRRPYKDLSDREGVIGYAIDLIDFDNKFEAAFWYVFRDTLIVDTLTNARRLMGGLRMVTLEGEVIEKSGAMVGGSQQQKSGLSFAASEKDKLVKIAEKITELDSKRSNAIKKLDQVEGHVAQINREIHEHDKEISKKQMQLEEISGRGERLEQLIEAKSQELAEIEDARKQLREEMDSTLTKKQEQEELVVSLEKDIEVLEDKLEGSEVPELNRQAEQLDEEIRRLDGRVRDIDSTLNALNLDRDYASNKIEENRELIKSMDEKKSTHKQRVSELKNKIAELEELLKEKQQREMELADELKELQQERTRLHDEHLALKKEFDKFKARFDEGNRQMMALNATKEALDEQVNDLTEEIQRRGIEETEEVPNYETVRTRIASIERAMERLEPVNMRAIDEYDEVESRLDELVSRRDTLSSEREQILERIKQYEQLKKDTFMETYNGINEPFKEIFHELSDGIGELVLDNYEDPFAGGLTLKAQPKEKTLQRLEAMSGGEKSLTALSFVFAIQQYRPAPFYAFDEIDMFLDGANAGRVAQRVKKAVKNAQFIVVSLRKPMIEAAERTIGVAMQENNITSITGVKLR